MTDETSPSPSPPPPPPPRKSEPLLDAVGKAIVDGTQAAEYLWQVPDDAETRAQVVDLLKYIGDEAAKKGRREMPKLCTDLVAALQEPPSVPQVDMLKDGFGRLYKLWKAAKSGMT